MVRCRFATRVELHLAWKPRLKVYPKSNDCGVRRSPSCMGVFPDALVPTLFRRWQAERKTVSAVVEARVTAKAEAAEHDSDGAARSAEVPTC